jgi:hypothetical protein
MQSLFVHEGLSVFFLVMALFDWPITTQKNSIFGHSQNKWTMWHSHLLDAKYPSHRALSAPFLGLTVQLCWEPCGSAAEFDCRTCSNRKEITLSVSHCEQFHAAGLGSHPLSAWQRPRYKRAGRWSSSTEAGGRHENNFS